MHLRSRHFGARHFAARHFGGAVALDTRDGPKRRYQPAQPHKAPQAEQLSAVAVAEAPAPTAAAPDVESLAATLAARLGAKLERDRRLAKKPPPPKPIPDRDQEALIAEDDEEVLLMLAYALPQVMYRVGATHS